jgi:hypothetical protein
MMGRLLWVSLLLHWACWVAALERADAQVTGTQIAAETLDGNLTAMALPSNGCFKVLAKTKPLDRVAIGGVLQVAVKLTNPSPSLKAAPLRYVLQLNLPTGLTLATVRSSPSVHTEPLVGGSMVIVGLSPIPASKKKVIVQFDLAVGACAVSPIVIPPLLSFKVEDGAAACMTRPTLQPVVVYAATKISTPNAGACFTLTAADMNMPKFKAYGPPGSKCLEQGTLPTAPVQPTAAGCFEACSLSVARKPLFFNYLQGAQGPECRCIRDACTVIPIALFGRRRRVMSRKLFRASLKEQKKGAVRALADDDFGPYEVETLATLPPTSTPTTRPTVSHTLPPKTRCLFNLMSSLGGSHSISIGPPNNTGPPHFHADHLAD